MKDADSQTGLEAAQAAAEQVTRFLRRTPNRRFFREMTAMAGRSFWQDAAGQRVPATPVAAQVAWAR